MEINENTSLNESAEILLPDLSDAESEQIANAVYDVLYKKKGRNIKVIKVREKTIIADYFVLCSGTSATQVRALAESVIEKLKAAGIKALRAEGLGERKCEWAAVDFGVVLVHVFTREAREFYNLDRLYSGTEEAYTLLPDDTVGNTAGMNDNNYLNNNKISQNDIPTKVSEIDSFLPTDNSDE